MVEVSMLVFTNKTQMSTTNNISNLHQYIVVVKHLLNGVDWILITLARWTRHSWAATSVSSSRLRCQQQPQQQKQRQLAGTKTATTHITPPSLPLYVMHGLMCIADTSPIVSDFSATAAVTVGGTKAASARALVCVCVLEEAAAVWSVLTGWNQHQIAHEQTNEERMLIVERLTVSAH